jgi:hypothetical protein
VRQPPAAVGIEHHAVEPEAQTDGNDLGEAEEAHGGRAGRGKARTLARKRRGWNARTISVGAGLSAKAALEAAMFAGESALRG